MSIYLDNRLKEAEDELHDALHDWKDSGGSLEDVIAAIKCLIDRRIQAAFDSE